MTARAKPAPKPKARPSLAPQRLNADHWYYEDQNGIELYCSAGGGFVCRITKGALRRTMARIDPKPDTATPPQPRAVREALTALRGMSADVAYESTQSHPVTWHPNSKPIDAQQAYTWGWNAGLETVLRRIDAALARLDRQARARKGK